MGLTARLATRVGERYTKSIYWAGCKDGREHFSRLPSASFEEQEPVDWPPCERCGESGPKATEPDSHATHAVYDTPSGDLEPGCLYFAPWLHDREGAKTYCLYWDNCTESHLMAVLPNGHHWDIDSRASNCGSPDDKLHRCWVKHGTPPNVTVDKNGLTCAAGAGSIQGGDYHGFLDKGAFVPNR